MNIIVLYLCREPAQALATTLHHFSACTKPVPYACDKEATCFGPNTECFNVNSDPKGLERLKTTASGVTNSFLYVGQAFTFAPVHTEDKDLFSINFQHAGKTKVIHVTCQKSLWNGTSVW